ncbi:MAG: NADP-dependent oxidoreductase [Rhodospirillaceae bacterium]|nr:MAG: NADP-dependent oxidoreductase [Rhodospirillaceae bacterium]
MQNRYWRLNRYPQGIDFDQALSLESEPLPPVSEGEVLIRADWLSMDAGTRMWMTPRTDGYQPPLPLGAKMAGLCLGRVVETAHPDFEKGDLVRGFGQWAEYSLIKPELAGAAKIDASIDDLRQHFGVLGMNAWTAYVGITEIGQAKAGQTVLVSAAAGATGLLACQIARNIGCQVIGIAGGPEKCKFLKERYDVAQTIDYRRDNIEEVLGKVEGGVHVYFDNVGGPILDAVLPNMALYGRIALCGLISTYDRDKPSAGPMRFDQILMRRLTVTGFFIPDSLERSVEFMPRLRAWMDTGQLTMPFDQTTGIENVLRAYSRMITGKNIGKVIVDVRD